MVETVDTKIDLVLKRIGNVHDHIQQNIDVRNVLKRRDMIFGFVIQLRTLMESIQYSIAMQNTMLKRNYLYLPLVVNVASVPAFLI